MTVYKTVCVLHTFAEIGCCVMDDDVVVVTTAVLLIAGVEQLVDTEHV